MSFILFHSLNVTGNRVHSAEKIHNKELKSPQYLDYHENLLIVLS